MSLGARRMSHPERSLRIASIDPAAREQSVLTLERDAPLEAAYTRVGQYCLLSAEGSDIEGHFVVVDPPGFGPLRFLLRAGGPAADALRTLRPGATLRVRGPLGDGFPLERAAGRDVLLVSAGAGLGAIRPLLLSLLPVAGRKVWLYHGTRTLDYVPFPGDLQRAQAQGAKVVVAVSTTVAGHGLANRVQNALERDKPDLSNGVAFVSGMDAMVDALKRILPRLGLADDRIYLNY
jgi:NAD(P)H-flavin reductase